MERYLHSLIRDMHLTLEAVTDSDANELSTEGSKEGGLLALVNIDSVQSLSFCIRSYIYAIFDRDFRHRLSSMTNCVAETRTSCAWRRIDQPYNGVIKG